MANTFLLFYFYFDSISIQFRSYSFYMWLNAKTRSEACESSNRYCYCYCLLIVTESGRTKKHTKPNTENHAIYVYHMYKYICTTYANSCLWIGTMAESNVLRQNVEKFKWETLDSIITLSTLHISLMCEKKKLFVMGHLQCTAHHNLFMLNRVKNSKLFIGISIRISPNRKKNVQI